MRWLRYSLLVLIPGFMLGVTHATTVGSHGDGYLQHSTSTNISCQTQNNADDTDVVVITSGKSQVRLPDFIAAAPCAAVYTPIYPVAQARAPPPAL